MVGEGNVPSWMSFKYITRWPSGSSSMAVLFKVAGSTSQTYEVGDRTIPLKGGCPICL